MNCLCESLKYVHGAALSNLTTQSDEGVDRVTMGALVEHLWDTK